MQSMEEIYRQHAQTVYRYLCSLTGDEGLSEELTKLEEIVNKTVG